jgi:hypothetical protein
MLNFNRANLSAEPLSQQINALIEVSEPLSENTRHYLGASSIGSECLRKIQFDWWCDSNQSARLNDIFDRGHFFEELTRERLKRIGFQFAREEQLSFSVFGGCFRGHADGILIAGPAFPGLGYPCIFEHKALNRKNWHALERDGLEKTFPQYVAQVLIYQAHLKVTNPALFTALNADTCERVHLLVPFDAKRAQFWSDRAVRVIEATRAGELLPRIADDPEDWRCRMCSHSQRCWK